MTGGTLKRFLVLRHTDVSGISGTGLVAEGVEFTDGVVVLRWQGAHQSTVVWGDIDHARAIHSHDGATEFRYLDDDVP
jgi:hypothetical protein